MVASTNVGIVEVYAWESLSFVEAGVVRAALSAGFSRMAAVPWMGPAAAGVDVEFEILVVAGFEAGTSAPHRGSAPS